MSTDAHLQFSGRVIPALISLCMAVARGRLTRLGGAPAAGPAAGFTVYYLFSTDARDHVTLVSLCVESASHGSFFIIIR